MFYVSPGEVICRRVRPS